jgi:hypothetical protein
MNQAVNIASSEWRGHLAHVNIPTQFVFFVSQFVYSLSHSLLGARVSLNRKFDQVSISYIL